MKKYLTCFQAGLQESMQYRVDFLLNNVSVVFVVAMQVYMWRALYGGREAMFSYSYTQMLLYTVLASMVARVTMVDLGVAEVIKSGELSRHLVKPSNYFAQAVSNSVGKQFSTSAIMLLAIAAALSFFRIHSGFVAGALQCFLFLYAMLAGFLVNVLLNFCISMAAFWYSEVVNLFSTIYIVQLLLSGGIFPLDIFGDVFYALSRALPFQYTIQFPVDIITGKLAMQEIFTGLLVQGAWILSSGVLAALLWRRGVKRYMAVGG